MKPSLKPGLSTVSRIVVDQERTIDFLGNDARVYATPSMILDIERACRDLIMEHADPGEDTVGVEIAIQHLAATLIGMAVEIAVRVASVEGKRITFDVTAKDEIEVICSGTHVRFIIDIDKIKERMKAKAARCAGLITS